jgi:hypothetical protein
MSVEANPYGYCPHCGSPSLTRERRPNGNDSCYGLHVYASNSTLTEKQAEALRARLRRQKAIM